MDYRSNCIYSDFFIEDEFPYADVWYKATVPSTGDIAIQSSSADGSILVSTVMVAYTLDGGVLTEIACDDSSRYVDFSSIKLSSQNQNQDIYIMVVENNK
jgi:hypothetical protein